MTPHIALTMFIKLVALLSSITKKIIDKYYGYYISFKSRDPFNPKLEDNLVKLTTIFSWPMWVAIFSL